MCKFHFKRLLSAAAAAVAALLTLSSCSSDDSADDSHNPRSYRYQTYVYGTADSHQMILDSITSAVSSVESSASWLTATPVELSQATHPAILIKSNRSGNEKDSQAIVTVRTENGDCAYITVVHSEMGNGDAYSGTNDEFIHKWWTYTTIPLQGISNDQRAPWDISGGANIPNAVRKQYTPNMGWEMAFCYLNDDTMEGVRFFALYNKWTGQMRVYTYINDPTGWGSDMTFLTYFGEDDSNDMYPFYNTFQFGIPSSHIPGVSLSRYAKIIDGQPQTFCNWISPYRVNKSINQGWYAFEFDMSGFVPKGKDWLKENADEAKFKFFAETKNTQQITLKGSLIGQLDGTFQNERIVQNGGTSALYGISNTLSSLSGMASSSLSSSNTYGALMTKNGGGEGLGAYLNPAKYWGGFACSMGAAYLGTLASELDPITYDTIPGKIDLALDATLELEGYISNYTANSFKPLGVSPKGIKSANGANGHVGKGVWGLAEDPVVYIDKDILMSNEDHIRYVNRGEGKYSQTEFDSYDLRLVWFFDPSSVKVNLNRDLFPDIEKVYVTTTCGVYPGSPLGHTDAYRSMLMLKERPTIDISQGKATGKLVTLSESTSPRLVVLPIKDLLSTDSKDYETKDNTATTFYNGSNMHYHGRLIQECGKDIVVEPQVLLPYTTDNSTFVFNNPTAPDFIVTVNVAFESQGSTFLYSKCFIPRIEMIDHATTKKHLTNLHQFADKCKLNQTTGTLSNDPSVPVVNLDGHKLMEKTLRMLDKLCK